MRKPVIVEGQHVISAILQGMPDAHVHRSRPEKISSPLQNGDFREFIVNHFARTIGRTVVDYDNRIILVRLILQCRKAFSGEMLSIENRNDDKDHDSEGLTPYCPLPEIDATDFFLIGSRLNAVLAKSRAKSMPPRLS